MFVFQSYEVNIQASAMTMRDRNMVPQDVYVLARVWSVQANDPESIRFKMYPDPHRMFYDGALQVTSDVEARIIRP